MIDNTSGGDSVLLGLPRLSLRGFPLALVRQIPLSTSLLAIFIHKHLAPKKDIKPRIQRGVNIVFAQC